MDTKRTVSGADSVIKILAITLRTPGLGSLCSTCLLLLYGPCQNFGQFGYNCSSWDFSSLFLQSAKVKQTIYVLSAHFEGVNLCPLLCTCGYAS